MTGGAEINFGGAREVYLVEFERGTGAREIYSSVDQMNKMKTKDSKGFSGRNRKFERFFRPKTGVPPQKMSLLKLQEIFRRKSEIQAFFPAENK